ncbi:MAG: hypothetical protein IE881_03390 [Epsilonproteobacteria bacterium]|nr:hypothetical protein [Campylobacterota bacterium]
MQFYYNYGYDLNLEASSLNVPDHIALELGFMQKLVLQNDTKLQMKFFYRASFGMDSTIFTFYKRDE